ncbi:MAG: hypothetical protein ABS882_01700 [Lysinibacillus sp.]
MNRLKGAFEEGFKELNRSEQKVKQRVLLHVEQEKPNKKYRMPKFITVLTVLFVVVVAGILATQFVKVEKPAAQLDDTYYEMRVYEIYQLSNGFITQKQAKQLEYYAMIENLSVLEYAKEHGLTPYEDKVNEQAEDMQKLRDDIMKEHESSWMHFHFKELEQQFGITKEEYLNYERNYTISALVANEMLRELFHDEIPQEEKYTYILEKSLAFYEEKYSEDLAAFRDKHNIDTAYEIKREGQAAVLTLGEQSYDTVYVDGKEVFKNTQEVLDTFMFQFVQVRQEIEAREGLTLFCYATIDDYRRGAKKLLTDKNYGLEAMRFIELLEVLKNSVEID